MSVCVSITFSSVTALADSGGSYCLEIVIMVFDELFILRFVCRQFVDGL